MLFRPLNLSAVFMAMVSSVLAQSSTTILSSSSSLSTFMAVTSAPSAEATATLLIQGNVSTGYNGAFIHANDCSNTYVLTCTDDSLCSSATMTLTQGVSACIFNLYQTSSGATVYASESCTFPNSAAAVCTEYVSATQGTASWTSSATGTFTGTQLHFAEIPITAGGNGIIDLNACTASASSTSSSSSSGSAIKVGVGVGVGVGGTLLGAGLVAGVFFFRRRRRQQEQKNLAVEHPPAYTADEKSAPAPVQSPINGAAATPVAEASSEPVVPELSNEVQVVELPNEDKRVELQNTDVSRDARPALSPQELPGDTEQLQ